MFRFCARVVPRAPPPLNRDLQANEKMSIAAPAQKLLRIVFRTYMSFPGFANPKKVFYRGPVCLQVILNDRFLGNGTK